jgi:protein-disulfide isomerase
MRALFITLILLSAGCDNEHDQIASLRKEIDELRGDVRELQASRSRLASGPVQPDVEAAMQSSLAPSVVGQTPVVLGSESAVFPAKLAVDRALADDPYLGPADAKIMLVAFSDFQCKTCRQFFSGPFQELRRDYAEKGRIKIVYRDFPLDDGIGAQTAELAHCAGEQGRYWIVFATTACLVPTI